MGILNGNAGLQNTSGDVAVIPGAAPVPTSNGLMNGNPQAAQLEPHGIYQPAPQAGAGQTLNTPFAHDAISRGNIPLNAQPTNAAVQPGGDSLLAQLARGQVSLNQSSYGQSQFAPAAGGQNIIPAVSVAPIVTGNAAPLTYAAPATYTGS